MLIYVSVDCYTKGARGRDVILQFPGITHDTAKKQSFVAFIIEGKGYDQKRQGIHAYLRSVYIVMLGRNKSRNVTRAISQDIQLIIFSHPAVHYIWP